MDKSRVDDTTMYEWVVGLSGLFVGVLTLPDLVRHSVVLTVLLFCLATYLEAKPVPLGKVVSSLLVALPMGAVALYGGAEAVWIMIMASLLGPVIQRRRVKFSVTVFNAGQYAISAFAMDYAYHLVHPGPFQDVGWTVFAGMVAGSAAFVAVNHAFLHFYQILRGTFQAADITNYLRSESVVFAIAFPFALLMIALSPDHPLLAPISISPLILLGQTFRIYRKMTVMQQVHAATEKLTAQFDLDLICEEAAKTAQNLTYADVVAVHILNADKTTLLPQCIYPLDAASEFNMDGMKEEDGGVIWSVIKQNRWEYVPDTRKDSRVRWDGATQVLNLSLAIFPMMAHNSIQGVIVCHSTRAYAFNESTEFISVLASQVAVLVENAKLYQELQEQSCRDGATGLYNYRFFYEMLTRRVEDAKFSHSPLSVAIVDMDYFKKFNDTYGHLAGDKVLASVGALLVQLAGPDVTVARYGGEEFGLILPYNRVDTFAKLEEIRAGVSKHVVQYDGYRLQGITISSGIASYPEDGEADRDILLKADSAMYWGAKQRGRNRTALYSPDFDAQLFVDGLTGLYTYHFVNIRMRDDFASGMHKWGIVCLDLDRFSYINTVFGFDVGDEVLRETSLLLRSCLRQNELACRYGGDEFLVVLPGASTNEVETICKRISTTVAAHRFECAQNVISSLRFRSTAASFPDLDDAADLFDHVGDMFAELHAVPHESIS